MITISNKRFRTKAGYCHILADKIILTRDGIIENATKAAAGNNIARILIIYGIIASGLIYSVIENYKNQDLFTVIFYSLMAIFLIYGILTSLNNSSTPVIERQSIQSVKFIKGITGFTRARFVVIFTDDAGKTKKRLIMLPGSLTGGKTETELAYKIMVEEKLIDI